MKVLPFKVPKPQHDGLIYQEDHEHIFYDKLHQHEEIQISYIQKGRGTLIVGDTVSDYDSGDIVIIGSNLPHVFKSELNTDVKSVMLTLFFTRAAFGSDFFDVEELRLTRVFFKKSLYGFKIHGASKTLKSLFLQLHSASKMQRFILFLDILKHISKAKTSALSTYKYDKQFSDDEGKRMREIMAYTTENFHRLITLDDIANVANMTKNAFCKYFKKRTNKTYCRFLNELRIEHASKLLSSNSDYAIAEIAELSGFNNLSNFNRTFKKIKGDTPSHYFKQYIKLNAL